MKIVTGDSVTFVYPFVLPDGEPNNSEKLIVWPDGTILVSLGRPMMSAENVRLLAKALLHAVEVSQKGQI